MKNNLNFEDSLKRLDEITGKLEEGNISLDQSLALFEEGIKLSRFCEKKLTETERKIEVLTTAELDTYKDDTDTEGTPDISAAQDGQGNGKKKKKQAAEAEPADENYLF